MVPNVQYQEIDGSIRSFDLKYLPISVLPVAHVKLKGRHGLTTIPMIFGIAETVIALETGLRHCHIRWLDKRTYESETYGDHAPYFDMCVNTDKSGHSWIRPTWRSQGASATPDVRCCHVYPIQPPEYPGARHHYGDAISTATTASYRRFAGPSP